jgi:hypothetical protein
MFKAFDISESKTKLLLWKIIFYVIDFMTHVV